MTRGLRAARLILERLLRIVFDFRPGTSYLDQALNAVRLKLGFKLESGSRLRRLVLARQSA